MILFIDTCVRPESRTKWLANQVLERIKGNDTVKEIKPRNMPLNNAMLQRRSQLAERGEFDDPIFDDARLFASADKIVIAAPYWDLSFPSSLKTFIEAINIVGLVFAYTEDGTPYGLCKAKKLIYVTTAGGPILSDAYGYGYIRELARSFYGIMDTRCVSAEGLDIIGADVKGILANVVEKLDRGH